MRKSRQPGTQVQIHANKAARRLLQFECSTTPKRDAEMGHMTHVTGVTGRLSLAYLASNLLVLAPTRQAQQQSKNSYSLLVVRRACT